jgi:hypothetical protein
MYNSTSVYTKLSNFSSSHRHHHHHRLLIPQVWSERHVFLFHSLLSLVISMLTPFILISSFTQNRESQSSCILNLRALKYYKCLNPFVETFVYVSKSNLTDKILIISLLMSPLRHRPSLWITRKENGPYHAGPVRVDTDKLTSNY